MRNKNKTVWSHRLGKANSKNFQRIGSSIDVDKRLYNEDIKASIVHTHMLIKQRIIPNKDGKKIIYISNIEKLQRVEKNLFFMTVPHTQMETYILDML